MAQKGFGKRVERQRRKQLASAALDALGEAAARPEFSPAEVALRFLNSNSLDFDRAIHDIDWRNKRGLQDVQALLSSGKARKSIQSNRAAIALGRNAIRVLERLKKLPPGAWVQRARALYSRDLVAFARIGMAPQEEAAVLLSFSAAASKPDPKSLKRGLKQALRPAANTPEFFEFRLKNALLLAQGGNISVQRKLSEARKRKAGKKAIAELETALQHTKTVLNMLGVIDALPLQEKTKRVKALLKKFELE